MRPIYTACRHAGVNVTTPSGGQRIFDHPQAERKSQIEPDRVGYDLGRKRVTTVKGIPNLIHALGIVRELTAVST